MRQHHYHSRDRATDPKHAAEDLYTQCKRHLRIKKKNGDKVQISEMYRIYAYDCPPLNKKAHHPTTGRAVDFSKSALAVYRSGFHNALRRTPNTALRLGYLDDKNAAWTLRDSRHLHQLLNRQRKIEDAGEDDLRYHAAQKAVDMKLGLDVATLAYKRLVDRIVLVTGDSDFVPAAKLARREGIQVILDPMWKAIRADLQEHVDILKSTIWKRKDAS